MTNFKLKLITYPTVSALIGACTAVITYCVGGYNILGAVLLGIGGALVASVIARVSLHLTQGDDSPFMYQVAIYHSLIAVGYLVFILAQNWGAISFGLAVMVGSTLMCLFTRFLESDEGKLYLFMQEKKATERYYPTGDVPGAPEDKSRPVCPVDGVNYTILEAEEKGFREEAAAALKGLTKVYAAVIDEIKEEEKGEKE